ADGLAVSRAAVELVLEAVGRVGAERIARAREVEVEVRGLAHWAVVGDGGRRRDVVDVDVEGLRVEPAILVRDLDRDGVAAEGVVGVGVALRSERALGTRRKGRVRRS